MTTNGPSDPQQPSWATPPQPHPQPSRWKTWHKVVLGVIAAFFVIVVIAAIAGGSSDDDNKGSSSSTRSTSASASTPETTTAAAPTTTTAVAAPPPATAAPTSTCADAPAAVVQAIEGSLIDSTQTLTNTFSVTTGHLTYIGANIMEGETKASSADVWVAQGGAIYAVSGSARDMSSLPDGRKVLDVSAGDEWGQQVQECVIAAGRR